MRCPVIGVMGASDPPTEVLACARELGQLIAWRGWTVLTGGCNYGVENAAAEGAKSAGGTAIGILPDRDGSRASPHLSYAIMTGVGEARNLINVMSSDVVVACPGELGTLSEVVFALKSGKRVILIGWQLKDAVFQSFIESGALRTVETPAEAVEQVAAALNELGHCD